jgi:hypothetical protein
MRVSKVTLLRFEIDRQGDRESKTDTDQKLMVTPPRTERADCTR